MAATLYLIRHGKPQLPPGPKRYIGTTDLPLSDEGKEQMKKVRRLLPLERIESVFSSPLSRCVDSALSLGLPFPITIVEDLQEIKMGDWENKPQQEIRELFPGEYEKRGRELATFCPPNGESFLQCQQRGHAALEEIVKNNFAGETVVMAHAGLIRSILCKIQGRPLADLFAIPQPYGCVNVLHATDSGFHLSAQRFVEPSSKDNNNW